MDFKVAEVTNMARVFNPPLPLIKKNEIQIYSPVDNEYLKEKLILYKKVSENEYLFPRALFENKLPIKESSNWKGINFNIKFELKSHQEEIVKAFLNKYRYLKTFGGIIKAKTGTGKTVVAIYIMSKIKLNTLIIVPTTYLLKQWVDRLLSHTDLKKEDIGVIQSKKCEYKKPVVIGMLPSLSSIEYPKEVYNRFGLTVYDEGHLLGAKTFSTVAPKFWDSYRLMLSATPRRKDKTEPAFLYNIGEIISSSNKSNATPKVIAFRYLDKKYKNCCMYNGKFIHSRFLNRLANDNKRTNIIAKAISTMYKKGRRILVLSDRKNLLKSISLRLPNVDYGWATGAKKDLNHRVILGTYQVAGLGLDIQELDTLVFATPRTDIEQAVGRILRKDEYTFQPLVVDFIDYENRIMQQYWYKRERFYNSIKSKIKFRYKGG